MKFRTDAKRDAILAVASKAFLELGYERTSMAEISARIGGSKATLYGYFASKEELFMATTRAVGDRYMAQAHDALAGSEADDDVAAVLRRVAETALGFLTSADAVAAHRMVMAEAGRSDVGRLFHEAGPARGVERLAGYLRSAMAAGRLREADATTAAQQLLALVTAEVQHVWFMRDADRSTRLALDACAERAVTAFLLGYGVAEPR